MELQFNKSVCNCLQKLVAQTQTQEQTQEIRLPDGMPDIGRVLGAWGQVLMRSKEWRGSGMGVSGGVMVWVLYMPEDPLACWTVITSQSSSLIPAKIPIPVVLVFVPSTTLRYS